MARKKKAPKRKAPKRKAAKRKSAAPHKEILKAVKGLGRDLKKVVKKVTGR